MNYINISGYKFIELANLDALQSHLLTQCQALDLKGTILISTEGINIFVSGTRSQIDGFYQLIEPHVAGIDFRESLSQAQPFKYMRVKIKKEIITFGVENIDPHNKPAPYVTPSTFKSWMDENKDMIILDTRNDYEVNIGQFKNAIHLNIQNFTSFAEAIAQLPDDYKKKLIVTYCTGGIRCEKAAPFLQQQGFEDVYQLQGGIISYLEQCGHEHYEGECFVFDNRTAVDGDLQETSTTVQCHVCRNSYYKEGQSCPRCINIV